MITYERLKELLHYDPDSGIFVWNIGRPGASVGTVAGAIRHDGYVRIGVDNKRYLAHRLAWLYVHGYMPENSIDHINRNPLDNRICNLREVSHMCNMRNIDTPKNNTSGVKGVIWNKHNLLWVAVIGNKTIKYSRDFTEAVAHRLAAEQCLGWAGCDSSSSAYKYMQEYLCQTK